ncbi:MAG: hypothetical protein AAGJ87_01055 [Pseudomonadota bacterium]
MNGKSPLASFVLLASVIAFAGALTANASIASAAETDDERDYLDGLQYRNIGPYRGGRATAIAGSAQDPFTFYMGATGGVFKTTNAGASWKAVSDKDFATAPVGAIDVAPSDPNVIVVGMGESPFRGVASSQGDGVYKSTDAGATWSHLGLEETRQISSIRIHPDNPDVFWIAAQGDSWGPSEARGVYKTVDGGATWRKTLVGANDTTGAIDLKLDPHNSRIVFAALWDHQRKPWEVRSGGAGGGLWKSVDGGETWKKLTGGLPEMIGKAGVAPSPAKSGRVWAVIEAADGEGGVYRSDDNGETWAQINTTREVQARSWYYMHIFADPKDADTVYVLNSPFLKSVDGGKTFTELEAPHVDHHDLWLNPDNPEIMANANDGGANISFDGGASWSDQHNQPTAQFYRVITDNQTPYRLYAGQQDNSTVAIRSRAPDGRIGRDDYISVGGGESAHVAFDPDNPRYIYAGSYLGYLTEYDSKTQTTRYIAAYPELKFGVPPKDRKYRWNWNAPVVVSAHDPAVIYHAGNHVMMSRDRGQSWKEHSPDLTRDEAATQGAGGRPITNEVSENYNTILALAESPHKQGVLWAGSDDGRLHITRNDGETWSDVTPPDVVDGMINTIEVSPHNAGRAYIAYTRYKLSDRKPYIFMTSDYGASWSRIDGGLPEEAFARSVREDPATEGLLFVGTERGVYFSRDAGGAWRPLQLNMPTVPITDLRIQGRDLIVATQGRAFWILDDISPLRQLTPATESATAHLYTPETAIRFQGGGGGNGGEAPNPPAGAVIYYALADEPQLEETPVKLEILGADGAVLRTLETDAEKGVKGGGDGVLFKLPAEKGVNRIAWDFRRAPVTQIPGVWAPGGGDAQIVPGHRLGPGDYKARLHVGDDIAGEASFTLAWDPRLETPANRIAEQQKTAARLHAMIDELHRSVNALRSAKAQAETRKSIIEENGGGDLSDAATAVVKAVDEWEASVITTEREFFQDVLNWPDRLAADLQALYGVVDGAAHGLTQGMKDRLADLEPQWRDAMKRRDAVIDGPIAEFNAAFKKSEAEGLALPPLTEGD